MKTSLSWTTTPWLMRGPIEWVGWTARTRPGQKKPNSGYLTSSSRRPIRGRYGISYTKGWWIWVTNSRWSATSSCKKGRKKQASFSEKSREKLWALKESHGYSMTISRHTSTSRNAARLKIWDSASPRTSLTSTEIIQWNSKCWFL